MHTTAKYMYSVIFKIYIAFNGASSLKHSESKNGSEWSDFVSIRYGHFILMDDDLFRNVVK